jgi:hypothetical protein
VASLGDPAHDRREALRDPAEDEKGAPYVRAVEELEQAVGVARHPTVEGIPPRARHDAVEGRHVEIVFDVHRHGVHDGARQRLDRRHR